MKRFAYSIFLITACLFASCNAIDVYEKTAAIPHHEWSNSNHLSFFFTATDTSAYYNIYFVIRHTESYHFNNIWLDFTSTLPGRKPQTQRLNIQLANANGWLGTSMDDIIEQRVLLFSNPTRLAKGDYTFSIQQVMREDPLQNVLNAGIRVEKVVQ
ncbi:MAG: gliding motility lipoprotein GldH [Parafilimonas sp.]